jgi:SRSO17 transposase
MDAEQIRKLKPVLERFLDRFNDCFARDGTRGHLPEYVRGQLSNLGDKSVAPMANLAGVPPRSLQEFLSLSKWDHGRVRDRLQEILMAERPGPHAVGLIDESSFVKRGEKTPGVKRQWCGVAGKTENCIVTVHLGYAVEDFHCLLDSALFLPEDWAADGKRREEAGIPETMEYRPKWQMALELYDRAAANGVRFEWVTFDEGYGGKPEFLHGLSERHQPFAGEVPRSFSGWLHPPEVTDRPFRRGGHGSGRKVPRVVAGSRRARSVGYLLEHDPELRDQSWEPYRVKDGERGPVVWEAKHALFYAKTNEGLPRGPYHLVIARNVLNRRELKFFLAEGGADRPATVETVLLVGFSRWHIERCFEDGKGEVGLDHYEGRCYTGLIRHLTLSAVSYLFLALVKEDWAEKKSRRLGLPRPRRRGRPGRVLVEGGTHLGATDRRDRPGHRRQAKADSEVAYQPHQEDAGEAAGSWHQAPSNPAVPVGFQLALTY